MEPLIVVDCYNCLYRSAFAFAGLSYEGLATGGIYGFLKAILDLRSISTRMVFCWDHSLPGEEFAPYWRTAIVPEYKSKRKSTESSEIQGLLPRLPEVRKVIDHLGYSQFGHPGWEADDLMGWLSTLPGEILLYTSDEDMYQLLTYDNRVQVLKPGRNGKKSLARVNALQVHKEYGIPIELWPDYLALGGDTSDGYTVKGMGAKTAAKMVMMGVDPERPFSEQHAEVQEKFQKWESSWSQVMKAIQISRVLRERPPGAEFPTGFQDKKKSQQKAFETFCADNGLFTIYRDRRKFFN